jgi:hypothetical protein
MLRLIKLTKRFKIDVARRRKIDSTTSIIFAGSLSSEDQSTRSRLAPRSSAANRATRCANVLPLLDKRSNCVVSPIKLSQAIEAIFPHLAMSRAFQDNAPCPNDKIEQEWLAQRGRWAVPQFIAAYRWRQSLIDLLLGLMHRHLTNHMRYRFYSGSAAALKFRREKVRRSWPEFCLSVTKDFGGVKQSDFLALA